MLKKHLNVVGAVVLSLTGLKLVYMEKISLLFVMFAFLTSCSVSYVPIPREYLLDETVEILQENATKEIVKAHEAEMGEKYGMTLYEPTDIKMYDKFRIFLS